MNESSSSPALSWNMEAMLVEFSLKVSSRAFVFSLHALSREFVRSTTNCSSFSSFSINSPWISSMRELRLSEISFTLISYSRSNAFFCPSRDALKFSVCSLIDSCADSMRPSISAWSCFVWVSISSRRFSLRVLTVSLSWAKASSSSVCARSDALSYVVFMSDAIFSIITRFSSRACEVESAMDLARLSYSSRRFSPRCLRLPSFDSENLSTRAGICLSIEIIFFFCSSRRSLNLSIMSASSFILWRFCSTADVISMRFWMAES